MWQVPVGKAAPGLEPAVSRDAVYAAGTSGTLIRVDPATGATAWRIEAAKRLSAGAGADATLVAVGTDKGDVLAFTADGKPLWQAKVTSEVVSPPKVAEGVVVVWSGDGRVFGVAASDGKTRWVYQRNNPPLTVRNYSGGVITRGGLFVGTAGGKLLALDLATGNLGWEANVATPKGATELERIVDITSLPFIDANQACAVAYQGRIACFDLLRGTLNWSRDVSSLDGLVGDARYLYVTDDKGAIHALDKTTGASAWKQDKLAQRRPRGPAARRLLCRGRRWRRLLARPRHERRQLSSAASRPTARRRPHSLRNPAPTPSGKARGGRRGRHSLIRRRAHPGVRRLNPTRVRRQLPMLPTLVLVGRPNVGKSTLFNRLTKSRAALVADFPGLTRDRHFGRARLGDRPFLVVDTGGFEPVATEGILFEMAKQTRQAIAEGDVILFLVDARQGRHAAGSEHRRTPPPFGTPDRPRRQQGGRSRARARDERIPRARPRRAARDLVRPRR